MAARLDAARGRRELLSPMVVVDDCLLLGQDLQRLGVVTRQQAVADGGVHPALLLHKTLLVEEGRQARLVYMPKWIKPTSEAFHRILVLTSTF